MTAKLFVRALISGFSGVAALVLVASAFRSLALIALIVFGGLAAVVLGLTELRDVPLWAPVVGVVAAVGNEAVATQYIFQDEAARAVWWQFGILYDAAVIGAFIGVISALSRRESARRAFPATCRALAFPAAATLILMAPTWGWVIGIGLLAAGYTIIPHVVRGSPIPPEKS